MDMTLDDIIKMSKKPLSKTRNMQIPNKNRRFLNGGSFQGNAAKVQRFMDSRTSLRQGVLAQRRSNFRGNQFPLTTEVAKKAAVAVAPIRNRAFTRPRVGTWNRPRVPSVPVIRKAAPEDSLAGTQAKVVPKQRPQTLDSLFADMKEQRMKALSRQLGNNQRNSRPPIRRGYQGRGAGGRPTNGGAFVSRNKFNR
ncbi:hypothetical protein H6P81_014401 [Aristolochia fimbriata]|uniref:UAP56-interacting factor n=1 Tax=Aristolochia fimbriata TaxID=158543 RepID=A0AAV7EHM9_ARIFI|nr:hypothetical protein H6P81_014401 [Aristolochia fimbriata]